VHRALAGIHVQDNAVGSVCRLDLSNDITVHSHQPDQIFLSGQQLGLEPMQRRRQRRATIPDLRRSDQTKRGVSRESLRVIEVLIASQPTVDRLSQQVGESELRVQAMARITQVLRDEGRQSEAFIQLADE
jgi:hypothetical protein